MTSLVLYMLLTPSLFYLGSRAKITQALWSRYPKPLAEFMDCTACAGTWYGFIIGTIGGYVWGLPFLGLRGDQWDTVVTIGICAMTWTPIIAATVQRAFETVGSAVLDELSPLPPLTPENDPARAIRVVPDDARPKPQ